MAPKECCHFILLLKILYLIFGGQNDLKWNKLSTKIVGIFEYVAPDYGPGRHTVEPGDQAAATRLSWLRLAVDSWCLGRATWLDLQPGRGEWRSFRLLLSLCHTRQSIKFLLIAQIGKLWAQLLRTPTADPETFGGISAHLPIVDAIDK